MKPEEVSDVQRAWVQSWTACCESWGIHAVTPGALKEQLQTWSKCDSHLVISLIGCIAL